MSCYFGDDLGSEGDRCTDPACYRAEVDAHITKAIAAKPGLVQISRLYGAQTEGSPVLPRNKYIDIREDRPKNKEEAARAEFKECKFTTEAIITEESGLGTIHKVCAHSSCPVHHPKQPTVHDSARRKADRETERREEAISRATELRTLEAITRAVPVRLMKRELLYVASTLAARLDFPSIVIMAKLHYLRKEEDTLMKLLQAHLRNSPEGVLSQIILEMSVLLSMTSAKDANRVLADAAKEYHVDTNAIGQKVKSEFAAKANMRTRTKAGSKPAAKAKRLPDELLIT